MPPNTQWKYVIVTPSDEPYGTDDVRVANEFAKDEDNMVIDMATCQFLSFEANPDGEHERFNIPEQTLYVLHGNRAVSAQETYDGPDED